MNATEPGLFSGITSALSSAWEGTKKAVSSVLPREETPVYGGRRRQLKKSRKTRKGGQTAEVQEVVVIEEGPKMPPSGGRRALRKTKRNH
jgi:hypothetical protein